MLREHITGEVPMRCALLFDFQSNEWHVQVRVWNSPDAGIENTSCVDFEEPLTQFPSELMIAQVMLAGG
jgi:hypothetical protein